MISIVEVIKDVVFDSLRMFPFLFLAFLLIELMEKYTGEKRDKILSRGNKAGPVIGALFGCIPQCGFSVVAANLYSERFISVGTLLAVFMSTSDEAILVMMGYPESKGKIVTMLVMKVFIAIVVGYFIDLFLKKKVRIQSEPKIVSEKCTCYKAYGNIWGNAWHHSVQMFLFILLFSTVLHVVISVIGLHRFQEILMTDSPIQVVLSATVGLIPNCAISILLTELYMNDVLAFSALMSGLLASGGMGLLVMWKHNRSKKESFKITMLLYGASIITGMLLNLFAISI